MGQAPLLHSLHIWNWSSPGHAHEQPSAFISTPVKMLMVFYLIRPKRTWLNSLVTASCINNDMLGYRVKEQSCSVLDSKAPWTQRSPSLQISILAGDAQSFAAGGAHSPPTTPMALRQAYRGANLPVLCGHAIPVVQMCEGLGCSPGFQVPGHADRCPHLGSI